MILIILILHVLNYLLLYLLLHTLFLNTYIKRHFYIALMFYFSTLLN